MKADSVIGGRKDGDSGGWGGHKFKGLRKCGRKSGDGGECWRHIKFKGLRLHMSQKGQRQWWMGETHIVKTGYSYLWQKERRQW